MPKIISYNVNGIRSAMSKGLVEWLKAANPDCFCMQEIKANPEQVNVSEFEALGYHCYWNPAQKKGYSGVAILSKTKPIHIEIGCGIHKYDFEGRVIRADFEDFSILNVYMPSGSSGEERQLFKFGWLEDFYNYLAIIRETIPHLVIVGDYNICHMPIDIHNPVSNANSSGFLPDERSWMEQLFNAGYIDTFRHFNKEPHHYTWWSFRAGSRGKNLGWRIDYQLVTKDMEHRIKRALILPEAKHSDHCPTYLEII